MTPQKISLLLLLLFLAGCIPAPFGPYYKPEYLGVGGTLEREDCHGSAGPLSKLTFIPDGEVSVSVSARKGYFDRDRRDTPLRIDVSIPEGKSIRFLSDQVSISVPGKDKIRNMPMEVRVLSQIDLPGNETVDFNVIGPISSEVARNAKRHKDWPAARAELRNWKGVSEFYPRSVLVRFPAVEVAGKTTRFEPARFDAIGDSGEWWKYETENHRQQREQRYNRCLKDTPQLHCKNSLEIIDEGLREKKEDIEYGARLWKTDEPHLKYSVTVEVHSTKPWRLKEQSIIFEDTTTGERRIEVVDMMHLVLGWFEVPLSTSIMGANSQTILRIEGSLGETLESKFMIQLPPLVIDNKRYDLQPFELELRLFDGGLEPFNC